MRRWLVLFAAALAYGAMVGWYLLLAWAFLGPHGEPAVSPPEPSGSTSTATTATASPEPSVSDDGGGSPGDDHGDD